MADDLPMSSASLIRAAGKSSLSDLKSHPHAGHGQRFQFVGLLAHPFKSLSEDFVLMFEVTDNSKSAPKGMDGGKVFLQISLGLRCEQGELDIYSF